MSNRSERSETIDLEVNGECERFVVEPGETLLSALREAGYYGVKNGCDEGVCGACNVVLNGDELTRSCLVPAARCDDSDVLTVDGLIGDDGELHPLQEAFLDNGAAQCGYCIPGVLLAAYALLLENHDPTTDEIAAALSGNVCRCTGYVQQIEAIQAAADRLPDRDAAEVSD